MTNPDSSYGWRENGEHVTLCGLKIPDSILAIADEVIE